MDKIELLQEIGDEICEGCGPHRDCGLEIDDCFRINNAIKWLDQYVEGILSKFSENPELLL